LRKNEGEEGESRTTNKPKGGRFWLQGQKRKGSLPKKRIKGRGGIRKRRQPSGTEKILERVLAPRRSKKKPRRAKKGEKSEHTPKKQRAESVQSGAFKKKMSRSEGGG